MDTRLKRRNKERKDQGEGGGGTEGVEKESRGPNLHNLITSKGELVLCIHPHSFLTSERRNAAGQIVPNANGF